MDVEDLAVEDVLLECFLRCGLTRICPGLELNFRVIWQLEEPLGLDSTDVLHSERDFPGASMSDRDLSKVPVEGCQVADQVVHTLICLVRVVEDLFAFVERIEQVLVHLRHVETLPEIGNTLLIIPYIFEPQQRIVSLRVHSDERLLNNGLVILRMRDLVLHILVHPLPGDANHIDVKVKSKLWLERYAYHLLGFGINNTFGSVKMEVLSEHLRQRVQLTLRVLGLAALFVVLWGHLQLYVDVTIAAIVDRGLQRFVETDGDGAEIDCLRLDLDHAIAAASDDLQRVLLDEMRLGHESALRRVSRRLLHETGARIVKANRILHMIVNVPCVYWNRYVIILLLQCSERGSDFALLVWQQEGLLRCELDLILVLVWHLPLVL